MFDMRQFEDQPPNSMVAPEVNPYIAQYWTHGPPVIRGVDAPHFEGDWSIAFNRKAPLVVEVGAGNGFYITGMANKHPDKNHLGIELRYKRVMLVAKKIERASLSNCRILRYDAWCLQEIFKAGTIHQLVTNHPDPWPKKKHQKNRLLGRYFCEWAADCLQPGGTWRIKTDFKPHIEKIMVDIEGLPLRVVGISESITEFGTPWDSNDDITTNYESKFIRQGLPVYACLLERLSDAAE